MEQLTAQLPLKDRILLVLQQRSLDGSEILAWEELLNALSEDQMNQLADFLNQEFKYLREQSDNLSLEVYIQNYRQTKAKMEGFLKEWSQDKKLQPLVEAVLEGQQAPYQPLSDKELEEVLENDDSLADYFSALSVMQIEEAKEALDSNEARQHLPEERRQELLDIYQELQEEAFEEEINNYIEAEKMVHAYLQLIKIEDAIEEIDEAQSNNS